MHFNDEKVDSIQIESVSGKVIAWLQTSIQLNQILNFIRQPVLYFPLSVNHPLGRLK